MIETYWFALVEVPGVTLSPHMNASSMFDKEVLPFSQSVNTKSPTSNKAVYS